MLGSLLGFLIVEGWKREGRANGQSRPRKGVSWQPNSAQFSLVWFSDQRNHYSFVPMTGTMIMVEAQMLPLSWRALAMQSPGANLNFRRPVYLFRHGNVLVLLSFFGHTQRPSQQPRSSSVAWLLQQEIVGGWKRNARESRHKQSRGRRRICGAAGLISGSSVQLQETQEVSFPIIGRDTAQ